MIGQTISHYTILEKLGEGGMGIVYKARDARLERNVAVKFLSSELAISPSEQERFLQEARAASSVNHPSICTVHDIGTHDGHMYFVMELVEGMTLLDIAGTKDEFSCLNIIRQAADGLGAAHSKQIVHRDIKSSNIMYTTDGRVKIMDFGLAKVIGRSDLTTVGSTVGTMAYMSPEQARGEKVDQRADIYSLGAVFFELLTGEQPFTASYNTAMLYQILNEEPPAPSLRKNGIAPSVDAIVLRCLAKNAADRYQSLGEMCADIDAILSGEKIVSPVQPSAGKKGRRKSIRRWGVPVSILVGVMILSYFFMPVHMLDRLERSLGLAAVPEQLHLAVLPIVNIGNPEDQALCDGLTETLTSQLTQLEQFQGSLWVVPSTEIRRVGVTSAEEARKSFGVNLVVDGSMQSLGDEDRLTINLVDPVTVRQINSASVDIPRKKLTLLQNEAVMKVLEMLHIEMHPEIKYVLQYGGTSLPSAFEYYLRGTGKMLRYEREENIDDAILAFQQAIRVDSTYAQAYAGLGEAYWRKYEAGQDIQWVPKAIAECKHAQQLDSALSSVDITLGIVYDGTGKPEKAISLFNAALKKDPSNPDAYRGLAKAYELKGELPAAEKTYQRSIDLRPDYWGGYNDLGVFYYKNNRYDDAIESFKKVITLTPDNYRGYNNLGGMYYFLERWSDAQGMFEHSYSIHPTARTASNLGTLNYVEGNFAKAAQWFEKALSFDTKNHLYAGNLASAYYWSQNGRNRAEELYRTAIRLAREQLSVNPDDPELLSSLGGYYAMVGEKDSSTFYTERALQLDKNDAGIMFHAGTTYESIGDRTRALKWIGKAIDAGYSIGEIMNQPELRELYKDPRYQHIIDDAKAHK